MRVMLASFVGGLLVMGAFVSSSNTGPLSTLHASPAAQYQDSQSAVAFKGLVPCGNAGQPACQACHFVVLAQNVVNWFIYISVFVAAVMFAGAGFFYLTSAGDEKKVTLAHSIFQNVFIGLIFILLGWLIVDTIMKTLFVGSELSRLGPWNEIQCNNSVSPAFSPSSSSSAGPSVTAGTEGGGSISSPGSTFSPVQDFGGDVPSILPSDPDRN